MKISNGRCRDCVNVVQHDETTFVSVSICPFDRKLLNKKSLKSSHILYLHGFLKHSISKRNESARFSKALQITAASPLVQFIPQSSPIQMIYILMTWVERVQNRDYLCEMNVVERSNRLYIQHDLSRYGNCKAVILWYATRVINYYNVRM